MIGLGLLVLRLVLGLVCIMHGAHMLFGAFSGPGVGHGGLTNAAQQFADMGLNPGYLLAVLAGLTQFAGGVLLITGFLTRYAAVALVVYYLILFWKQHAPWGFFLNWQRDPTVGHGYEFATLMIGALACLALAGAGEWSFDGRRAASAESRAAGRARITRHS